MFVELKVFGGVYFLKDKVLKKYLDLKLFVIVVNVVIKVIVEVVIFGKLVVEYFEYIDDYFKVKIWEYCEEFLCFDFDVFLFEFFESVVVWNVNVGELVVVLQLEVEVKEEWEDNKIQEEIKIVVQFDLVFCVVCLVLFGLVSGIILVQYGQIVDLKNDDEFSFVCEFVEVLVKECCVFELVLECQE